MKGSTRPDKITDREFEIIQLLYEKLSNDEIAERLFLAPSTVKWYIRQLNSKFHTSNRNEIVAYADRFGLITDNVAVESRPNHNLPRSTTTFVGRDAEIDEINRLIDNLNTSLLTIKGHGGVGKTRIALEVAQQQLYNYPDGVYWVDLTPLDTPEQIVRATAEAVGFQLTNQGIGFSTANQSSGLDENKNELLAYLADKKYLLIFDNFEHLLSGAKFIHELLDRAPKIKILATSRERLPLSSQNVCDLYGMHIADQSESDEFINSDAVALFETVARKSRSTFHIQNSELQHIWSICHLTGGLPLALLLAATWTDTLSLSEIAKEMQESIEFLSTNMSDLPERHRSISAVFDTTWNRIDESQKVVLRRTSVFRSSVSLDTLQAITDSNSKTLRSMVHGSLIQKTDNDRYALHDLLRQYAYTKLEEANEVKQIRNKCFSYFSTQLAKWAIEIKGPKVVEALNEISPDFENLRLVWRWAVDDKNFEVLDQAWFPLFWFCKLRWRNDDGAIMFKYARQELAPQSDEEPHTLWARFLTTYRYPELREKRGWQRMYLPDIEMALNVAQKHRNRLLQIHCYRELTEIALATQELRKAVELASTAVDVAYEYNDPFELIVCLRSLAFCHSANANPISYKENIARGYKLSVETGNLIFEASFTHLMAWDIVTTCDFQQSESLIRRYQKLERMFNSTVGIVDSLWALGWFAYFQGQLDEAEEYLSEALKLANEINDTTDNIPFSLIVLSFVKIVREEYLEAQELCNQARALNNPNPFVSGTEVWARARIALGLHNYATAHRIILNGLKNPGRGEAFWAYEKLCSALILLVHDHELEFATEILALVLTHPQSPSGWMKKWPLISRLQKSLRTELGDHMFDEAWQRGIELDVFKTVDKVVSFFDKLENLKCID